MSLDAAFLVYQPNYFMIYVNAEFQYAGNDI